MRHARAVAVDFDGTLADNGVVAAETLAALSRVVERRVRLLLVTGRRLASLEKAFPHFDLFDRVVAENGALVYDPRRKQSTTLAAPPPDSLLEALRNRDVPFAVGRSVVETVLAFQDQVQGAIRDAGVEWNIHLNRNSVMILPADVTKAIGLASALEELGVTPAETAAIGDAENDRPFLAACGIAIAVANAVPSLKSIADRVTAGSAGDGVVEAIGGLLG